MIDTAFIKARREALGLTQDQAAKRAGMATRHHWSRIETGGRANPRAETLTGIARALECQVDQVLGLVRAPCTKAAEPRKPLKKQGNRGKGHVD